MRFGRQAIWARRNRALGAWRPWLHLPRVERLEARIDLSADRLPAAALVELRTFGPG